MLRETGYCFIYKNSETSPYKSQEPFEIQNKDVQKQDATYMDQILKILMQVQMCIFCLQRPSLNI